MELQEVDESELALLFQLGLMIREAAGMEMLVEATVRHLEAGSKPGSTALAGQSLSMLLREGRKIAKLHPRVDGQHEAAFLDLLGRVAQVSVTRNAYVHGAWTDNGDGTFLAVRGQRGQSDFAAHPMSVEQLSAMVQEIRSISSALKDWIVSDLDKRDEAASKEQQ